MKKSLIDHSKTVWTIDSEKYPGDQNIIVGCLQRIADASELSSKNIVTIQNDLLWYKKQYEAQVLEIKKLTYRISGLRGCIQKMKNKYAKKNETSAVISEESN